MGLRTTGNGHADEGDGSATRSFNAACPGFRGTRNPGQGAATAIQLASLSDDGPAGGFFKDVGMVPW